MIELNNIRAGYLATNVLNGVSLNVNKGEVLCIIGVNGCGKSTLLKAIAGLIPLRGGDIFIDGNNISTLSRGDVAKKIAYLSQERGIGDMTVEEAVLHGRFPHLSYPRRYLDKDKAIAKANMEEIGIAHLAKSPLYTLSGGMRQNVYIAMALTQCTDYILLDEPTTFLDVSHSLCVMKTLHRLAQEGKGIVAVMHDLPLAFNFAHKIAILNNGVIECVLSPRELCSTEIIKNVFGIELLYSPESDLYAYKYKK